MPSATKMPILPISPDFDKDMGGDALDLVKQLCQYTEAWRDGAAALAREGFLEIGAGQGPGEFFKGLRATVERLQIDLQHYRGAATGATAMRVQELELEVTRLTGELAAEERKVGDLSVELARRIAPDPAIAALDDFKAQRTADLLQVRGIATDAAMMVLDTLNPRAEGQPPHQIRVHMPGAGLLRVIVAADVTDDVLAELESEVDDKVAERVTSISIEREPGGLPDGQGYEIKEHVDGNGEDGEGPTGVHPGSPATEEWMVYHWENAELDDGGQHRRSKAEAIDDVWVDYAATVLDAAQVRSEGEEA